MTSSNVMSCSMFQIFAFSLTQSDPAAVACSARWERRCALYLRLEGLCGSHVILPPRMATPQPEVTLAPSGVWGEAGDPNGRNSNTGLNQTRGWKIC
jgi:hypothetical protein